MVLTSPGFTRSTPKGQLANLHTLDVVPDNGYKITTIRFQYNNGEIVEKISLSFHSSKAISTHSYKNYSRDDDDRRFFLFTFKCQNIN